MRPHCEGVQAGVCQRIFSLTAQIVCLRQEVACGSAVLPIGSPSGTADVSPPPDPAAAWEGAAKTLASAAVVPKDKARFRRSASTISPPVRFDGSEDLRATTGSRAIASNASGGTKV